MGHKSRVCAVLFDTKDADYAATVEFWGAALGRSYKFEPEKRYTTLSGYLDYTIQNVGRDHQAVHVDIETDNVDAEVARLEALGAHRKYKIKSWWVLEDPGGHAFCVVPVESKTWPECAKNWPDF